MAESTTGAEMEQDLSLQRCPRSGTSGAMRTLIARPATTSDADALARLLSSLAAEEGLAAPLTPETIAAALGRWIDALVLDGPDGLIGAAVFYPGFDLDTATGGLHLEALIIDEAHRNHGFGLQLLAAVAAKARADGGAWVAWYARAANRSARRFYRRIGAREEKYLNLYVQDQAFDALADQGLP